MKTLR